MSMEDVRPPGVKTTAAHPAEQMRQVRSAAGKGDELADRRQAVPPHGVLMNPLRDDMTRQKNRAKDRFASSDFPDYVSRIHYRALLESGPPLLTLREELRFCLAQATGTRRQDHRGAGG